MSRDLVAPHYSMKRVIVQYCLFEGMIGGAILCIYLTIKSRDILMLSMLPMMMYFSLILGFIPALLTGVFVAAQKLYRSWLSTIKAAVTGLIVGMIYASGYVEGSDKGLLDIFLLGLVGALSSALLSRFVLPKSSISSEFSIITEIKDI